MDNYTVIHIIILPIQTIIQYNYTRIHIIIWITNNYMINYTNNYLDNYPLEIYAKLSIIFTLLECAEFVVCLLSNLVCVWTCVYVEAMAVMFTITGLSST